MTERPGISPELRRLLAVLALVTAAVVLLAWSALPARGATANVGQHIHIEIANHPVDGHPIPRGPYTFHLTVKLHQQTGAVRWFRLDDWDHAGPQVPLRLGPCSDCQTSFDYTVDFARWTQGRHELRWHVDIGMNSEGNRQFTTARTQVCLGTCINASPANRVTPFNGGGSWYLGDYATPYVLTADRDIKPGGSIKVRAGQDARKVCVLANPDIHNGSSGTVLGCFADTANHSVSLAGRSVGDKLLVLAMQPNGNAGAIRLTVGDGSDQATADYEIQSWWAKGGVVLP